VTLDRDRIVRALPSYEVGEEIGRGAWGVVVVARHRQLGRSVAVKELPAAFASDPGVRRRFASEARLLAGLDHPHIVPIYDYVEDEGLCLLVMELLSGGTVWSRFSTEGVTAAAACGIVVAACSALHYAHTSGILHRDIKPDNLLFSGTHTLKVSDFGIAKVVGGAESMGTRTGEVLGTPAYMAPEQALGTELTPATDVYALGTVLYELLSGRLPFSDDGNAIALLYRHVHEEPVPLAELRPDLAPELVEVTMRSLARDPSDRYASAEEFGVALADAATAAWGHGWVRAGGVNVVATGRIGERITGPAPGSDVTVTGPPDRPTRSTRASATVADEPVVFDDEPAAAPEELVPLSEMVAAATPEAERVTDPVPAPAPPTAATPAVTGPTTTPAAPTAAVAATASQPRRRGALLIAAGVVVVVALVAGYLLTRGGGSTSAAQPRVVATIPVGAGADHVAVGNGGVWVTSGEQHAIIAIDQTDNKASTAAELGVPLHSIIVANGSLWVSTPILEILRVDPGNDPAHPRVTPMPASARVAELAEGDGSVYASHPTDGTVQLFDAHTNQPTSSISGGNSPDSVAVGEGGVWVADRITTGPGAVTRVDSAGHVIATITVGSAPEQVAVGAGSVWVANSGDGTVSRIDPATNQVVATIRVGTKPKWVIVGYGSVWVTDPGTDTLYRLDPATNKVTGKVAVGRGAESTAIGDGSIWVVNQDDGTVSRVVPNG
jgi:YVTN family beta-propeller protein